MNRLAIFMSSSQRTKTAPTFRAKPVQPLGLRFAQTRQSVDIRVGCMRLLRRRLVASQLERLKRTNHDVVSIPVSERELLGSSIRVLVRLFFEPGDERA